MMQLIRQLLFAACVFRFEPRALHIEGQKNRIADALSRNFMSAFCMLAPGADKRPTHAILPPSEPW